MFANEIANNERQPTGRRYSDKVKKLALTVQFYSTRTYEYFRTVFKLPAPSSLSNWMSSVNFELGFDNAIFDELKARAVNDAKFRNTALMMDSMHIKARTIYNEHSGKFDGFVDYGGISVESDDNLATEAFVFLLVGLQSYWKYPVGYDVLVHRLTSYNLAALVQSCLQKCESSNIKVHTLTCDGCSVNMDCLKQLGCKFGSTLNQYESKLNIHLLTEQYMRY